MAPLHRSPGRPGARNRTPARSPRRGAVLHAVRAAALTALVAAGLAACAVPPPDGAPDATDAGATTLPALPDGVTVAVTQRRSDVAERQAEVQIRNGSERAIEIGAVRLDDPRFAASATRVVERTSTLAPGRTVDVRVQLAAPVCGGAAGTPTVTLDYAQDGRSRTGAAPVREVFPFLEALHRRECDAHAAAEAADLAWSAFTASDAGAPASLELSITPSPGAAADLVLTGIRETNLLTFAGARGGVLPLGLSAADALPERRVDLPVLPARCDPHAVQEDKRGTVFTLDIELDGRAGQITLAADAALRGRILAWVSHWCGHG